METADKPLSFGIRQAMRDSLRTTYEIGRSSGVLAQNLYRFLDEGGARALSQKSFDKLGLVLRLKLTLGSGPLIPGYGKDYRITSGPNGPIDIHKLINGTGDVALSAQLGRAVKLHRKTLVDIAEAIKITPTHLYRFLDGTRGLSQARLDALCSFLGLLVEGPQVIIPSRLGGTLLRMERRIYRPIAAAQPQAAEKRHPSPPTYPPSLYTPSEDDLGDDC